MFIKFIKNSSLEAYANDVKVALNYNDETLQYLKISLEVYLKNLSIQKRKEFINELPDFIEVDQAILKEKSGKNNIKSLRQLAELSITNNELLNSKKIFNSDKLLITIIVLFSILQNYMKIDSIPILKSEIDSNTQQRILLNISR